MSQQAKVRGEVCFRAGDGPMVPIPDGPVDIDVAADSVTFGWTEEDGTPNAAAIPRDEYDRYVKEGKIKLVAA